MRGDERRRGEGREGSGRERREEERRGGERRGEEVEGQKRGVENDKEREASSSSCSSPSKISDE